jgi:hypothetical protein
VAAFRVAAGTPAFVSDFQYDAILYPVQPDVRATAARMPLYVHYAIRNGIVEP